MKTTEEKAIIRKPLAWWSADYEYRYLMRRHLPRDMIRHKTMFDPRQAPITVAFIGLNPSTATETEDDPTIRRCIGFATDWEYESLVMLNAFAFRSTDPAGLRLVTDPVGRANDETIMDTCRLECVQEVVLAWGVHGKLFGRGDELLRKLARDEAIAPKLRALGFSKNIQPAHPLYLKKDTARLRVEVRPTED